MSVARCKLEVTSSEFIAWKIFLQREANKFHREDYYLAQIAREIRGVLGNPDSIPLDYFRFKFDFSPKEEEKEESEEHRMQKSKMFWFGAAGYLGDK